MSELLIPMSDSDIVNHIIRSKTRLHARFGVNHIITSKPRLHARFGLTVVEYEFLLPPPKVG